MAGRTRAADKGETSCLEIEALTYAYGKRLALDNVSFSLRSGRLTALLGPNGAGKSTLIALLSGLVAPLSGRIVVLGHDFARHPRRALAAMGIVFQQQTLDLDLTVSQNMSYFAALHGMAGAAVARRRAELLERFGLEGRERERARALNNGHRRRLEIARALLHGPRFLLLDEATVGLDVPARLALVQHVHALARESGLTVLWATHLVDEVWPEDDLIVLHRGEVREAGPLSEVLARQKARDVLEVFSCLTERTGAETAKCQGVSDSP